MKTCLSIDLDDYAEYRSLVGSGEDDSAHSFYDDALPRWLDLFERFDARATFFAVGKDLSEPAKAKRLREAAERGHEIGNHSWSHPYNFRALSRLEKGSEIAQAEAAIADATGVRPVGFRAPSCEIDLETLEVLEERDYVYDTSVFPTPVMWAFMLYGKLFVKHESYQLGSPSVAFAPATPYFPAREALHRRRAENDTAPRILEIPFSVIPGLRIPFYSTLLRRFGGGVYERLVRLYPDRQPMLHTLFHMIELAEFDHTPLARGFEKSPGLAVPLAERQRFLEAAVGASTQRGEAIPLGEFASAFSGARSSG